jgi:hypothetical protein
MTLVFHFAAPNGLPWDNPYPLFKHSQETCQPVRTSSPRLIA